MNLIEAHLCLGISLEVEATESIIRKAFYTKARQYHPDSPLCQTTKEQAGQKMGELMEARNILLEGIGSDPIKEDWRHINDIMSDIWNSGCIWDSTKEFPSERLVDWVVQSPIVYSFLDKVHSSIVDYTSR